MRVDVTTPRAPFGREFFSLIELLVVSAIIAILLAVLLPALAKARDTAKNLLCQNNLKQLSVALASYPNDFDDYLCQFFEDPSWTPATATWSKTLLNLSYLPSAPITRMPGNSPLLCPLGQGNSYYWSDAYPTYDFATSYAMNMCVCGYLTWTPRTWHRFKLSALKSPSTYIHLIDAITFATKCYGDTGYAFSAILERHAKRANILFVDGHAGQERKAELGDNAIGNVTNAQFRKWWGPYNKGGY